VNKEKTRGKDHKLAGASVHYRRAPSKLIFLIIDYEASWFKKLSNIIAI